MGKSLIQSGLPSVPAGADNKSHGLLLPIYVAINGLASKMAQLTGQYQYEDAELPNISPIANLLTQNATKIYAKATEIVDYGKMCNLHLDSGDLSARLASSASAARPAHCVCDTPGGLAIGEFGTFLLYTGMTQGISGSGVGSQYYLGTAGNSQLSRPAVAGSIIQAVGTGLGSLGFYVQISSLYIQN